MAAETLEQKTFDSEKIVKDFEKAIKSKNAEKALNELREIVSRATYDGTIDYCTLVNISRRTQMIIEEYNSGKKYRNNKPSGTGPYN